jgi:hypothetical protein
VNHEDKLPSYLLATHFLAIAPDSFGKKMGGKKMKADCGYDKSRITSTRGETGNGSCGITTDC